jgi:apolipoprotein D and lipocalin family protein
MQFIWPIKTEYRIIYLTEEYTQTVIGRSKRDYVWIMARKPWIPDTDYGRILAFLRNQGYSLDNLRKVPHGPAGSESPEKKRISSSGTPSSTQLLSTLTRFI